MAFKKSWNLLLQPYKACILKTIRTNKNFYGIVLHSKVKENIKKMEQKQLKKHKSRIAFQCSAGQFKWSAKQRLSDVATKKVMLLSTEFILRSKKKVVFINLQDTQAKSTFWIEKLLEGGCKLLWIAQNTKVPYNGCRLQKQRKV